MINLASNNRDTVFVVPYHQKKQIAEILKDRPNCLVVDLTHFGEENKYSVLSPLYPHHIFTPYVKEYENVKAASLMGMIEALKIFETPQGNMLEPEGTKIDVSYFEKFAKPGQEFVPRLARDNGPFYGYAPIDSGLNIYLDQFLLRTLIIPNYYLAQLNHCSEVVKELFDEIRNGRTVLFIDYDSFNTPEFLGAAPCFAQYFLCRRSSQLYQFKQKAHLYISRYVNMVRASITDAFSSPTIWPMNTLMAKAVNSCYGNAKNTKAIVARSADEACRLPKDVSNKIVAMHDKPAEYAAKNVNAISFFDEADISSNQKFYFYGDCIRNFPNVLPLCKVSLNLEEFRYTGCVIDFIDETDDRRSGISISDDWISEQSIMDVMRHFQE